MEQNAEQIKEWLLEAYRECPRHPLGVLFSDLGSAMKKLCPEFHADNYGGSGLRSQVQNFPADFRIIEDRSLTVPRFFVEQVDSASEPESRPQGCRKRGVICDLREDRGFGFIAEDDPPSDLEKGRRMFRFRNVPEPELRQIKMRYAHSDQPIPVTYSLCPSANIANLSDLADQVKMSDVSDATRARMALKLRNWCFFQDQEGMLRQLASSEYTLPEDWGHEDGPQPYPILWNYLQYTFKKLQTERLDALEAALQSGASHETYDTVHTGVLYSPDFKLAAFNTGLVNNYYEPVIAVFEANDPYPYPPYKFRGFCIRGEKLLGKEVQARIFGELDRAKYFNQVSDCVYLDPSAEVQADWDHIILDGIRRGRFPDEFILDNCARALRALNITHDLLTQDDLERIERFIREEELPKTFNNIKGRIETALKLALKRVTWNFKTVSPVWYPKAKYPTLLVPLALVDDRTPDAALVVEQIQQQDGNGHTHINYTAHTIYTLKIAYNNSRLITKPDSDWLVPQWQTRGDENQED